MKVINAENAAYQAPDFSEKFKRTYQNLFDNITQDLNQISRSKSSLKSTFMSTRASNSSFGTTLSLSDSQRNTTSRKYVKEQDEFKSALALDFTEGDKSSQNLDASLNSICYHDPLTWSESDSSDNVLKTQ